MMSQSRITALSLNSVSAMLVSRSVMTDCTVQLSRLKAFARTEQQLVEVLRWLKTVVIALQCHGSVPQSVMTNSNVSRVELSRVIAGLCWITSRVPWVVTSVASK